MSNSIFNSNMSNFITELDLEEAQEQLKVAEDRFALCSALEDLSYCFSVILSEVREEKREILSAIFEEKPKLAEEKSVLEKKLDAEPQYADCKKREEYLFNFINHLSNTKDNLTWLTKKEDDSI